MNSYELTFIMRPDLDENGFAAATDRIVSQIQTAGGEIIQRKIVGKRRLAYPIRKFTEGTYVLFALNLVPSAVPGIERNLKLSEQVLRHLVVRLDEPLAPLPAEPAAPAGDQPGESAAPPSVNGDAA